MARKSTAKTQRKLNRKQGLPPDGDFSFLSPKTHGNDGSITAETQPTRVPIKRPVRSSQKQLDPEVKSAADRAEAQTDSKQGKPWRWQDQEKAGVKPEVEVAAANAEAYSKDEFDKPTYDPKNPPLNPRTGKPMKLTKEGKPWGRPAGSKNKVDKALKKAVSDRQAKVIAKATGLLPHEALLQIMQHFITWQNTRLLWKSIRVDIELFKWAAEKALPYYGQKLPTMIVGPNNGPVQVLNLDSTRLSTLSVEELLVMEKVLGRLQGVNPRQIEGSSLPRGNGATLDPSSFGGEIEDIDPIEYEKTLS